MSENGNGAGKGLGNIFIHAALAVLLAIAGWNLHELIEHGKAIVGFTHDVEAIKEVMAEQGAQARAMQVDITRLSSEVAVLNEHNHIDGAR